MPSVGKIMPETKVSPCDLPGHRCEEQHQLYGHQKCATESAGNGRFVRAPRIAERTDQTYEDLGYGAGIQHAHDYAHNFVALEFLPDELSGTSFYEPGQNQGKQAIKEFLKNRWKDKYDH